MSVNCAHKCLFKVYTRSIALGVGPVQTWQQGYHNNVWHIVLRFRLSLGRSLHFLLVFLLSTLNIFCLLRMSLNANLYLWELLQNISLQPCQASSMRCSSQIFVCKLLWQCHFWFLLFYCSSHWENLLNVINETILFFTCCFISLLTLSFKLSKL